MIMEQAPITNLEEPTPLQTEKHITSKFEPEGLQTQKNKYSSEKRMQ